MEDYSDPTQKIIDFPNADVMTFDKTVRSIIENLFDYDSDHGYLTATINRGKDNEAEVTMLFKIISINQIDLENLTEKDVA
jgi:hypothetical protein